MSDKYQEKIKEMHASNKIVLCDCFSHEHQIILQYDDEDNELYLYIHLNSSGGFFRRLKNRIQYLFGFNSSYGAWDEFIISASNKQQLINAIELIK